MSNPFSNPFDPFAGAPAPSSSSSRGGGGGAPTANNANPFDTLGSFVSTATASAGNGLWKNVVASTTTTTTSSTTSGSGSSSSRVLGSTSSTTTAATSSSSSSQPPALATTTPPPPRRIVPYNHQHNTNNNTNNNISTLETNWDPWLYAAASASSSNSNLWTNGGNFMTYLIAQTNAAYCFTGRAVGNTNNTNNNNNGMGTGNTGSSSGNSSGLINVENVLKWRKLQHHHHHGNNSSSRNPGGKNGISTSGGGGVGGEAMRLGNFDSSLSLTSDDSMTTDEGGNTTTTTDEVGVGSSISSHNSIHGDGSGGGGGTTTNITKPKGGGGSMQRFLKSNLKKAQQSIERSVATIAIKADIGKNPDQICVSLHYLGMMNNNNNGGGSMNVAMAQAIGASGVGVVGGAAVAAEAVSDVCLSRTEWTEIPTSSSSSSSGEESKRGGEGGVLFSIPLCVPDLSFLETTTTTTTTGCGGGGGVRLTIRLHLRSGAALLKAVSANREYCIGECSILYSNVIQARRAGAGGGGGAIRAPFTSGIITEIASVNNMNNNSNNNLPALLITAVPRIKFNPPCTYGWSLTDPVSTPPLLGSNTTTTTTTANWLNMFQLPLDSGYAFRLPGQGTVLANDVDAPSPLLLANERAVESTLVLPLATACSHLFSLAATQSKTLMMEAATKLRRRETRTILPEDDETRSRAEIEAALSDGCVFVEVGVKALLLQGGASFAEIGFGSTGGEISSVKVRLSFQPSHCIFEESVGGGSCPLFDQSRGAEYMNSGSLAGGSESKIILSRFCTSICTASNDFLLPGVAGTRADGKHVGSLRFEVAEVGCNNHGMVDNIWTSVGTNATVEGLIELEDYLVQQQQQQQVLVPAISNGRQIGSFVVFLRVRNNASHVPTTTATSTNSASVASLGLVALAGLSPVTEGLGSFIDGEFASPKPQPSTNPPSPADMRRRQIETMGAFISSRFLANQTNLRDRDAQVFGERYDKYNQSLQYCMSRAIAEDDSNVPLFKRRLPRAFRPSSSRDDALLTGIGFNVHVQSLSLNALLPGQQTMQMAVTQSITHGAPADHARGFFGRASSSEKDGKKLVSSEDNALQGGLRRLEMKRLEIAKELDECVTGLIVSDLCHSFQLTGYISSTY
jgi:hypothetical protein